MDFQSDRPEGDTGKADQYLPDIIQDLKRVLIKAQDSLAYKTLHLSKRNLGELAIVLVEFTEDIHNDIGIWKALEQYNLEFFGMRLPFSPLLNKGIEQKALNKHRICHLLWVLYSELKPQLVLSPTHKDLLQLAILISNFLEDRFTKIPHDSEINIFLAQPNTFGWEIKKKLLWLGQHSYLFRHSFRNYMKDKMNKTRIPVIDDFVCQETTAWSGLGVIDILAKILNITEQQRSSLRSWYERHVAYYRILKITDSIMEVVNIINDKPYIVNTGGDTPFKVQQVIFGSLVAWNDEWYWSGAQLLYNNVTDETIQHIKNTFPQESPRLAYCYCDQLAKKAKELTSFHYQEFVKYHGDDLVIYPDGLSMAADLQKKYRLFYESQPEEDRLRVIKKYNLQNPWPKISLPPEILETKDGVGVYYNPDEGQEVMVGFNDVVNGFMKKGVNLNEDDADSIRSFIFSDSISPNYVKKLVQKYGDESIASAFLIHSDHYTPYLDYLLRRYKGHFYRNRYPSITLV